MYFCQVLLEGVADLIILGRLIHNVNYLKMPAFPSILAEIPSYACNVRVSTKTHNMHARHALQQKYIQNDYLEGR